MIVCDPARNFGWPSIAGTRIGIEHVAGDIAAGQTIEQYAADKELTVEQVQEALTVYKLLRPLYEAYDELHPEPDAVDEEDGPEEPAHE